MKVKYAPLSLLAAALLGFSSCQDEVSGIGSSIFNGEVAISVDSTTVNLRGKTIEALEIDARSTTNLLGHINIPEFGDFSAAYVTQMLAASDLQIPDSIKADRVDSLKLTLLAPRSGVIGDTLAPQQLKAFVLQKNLPNNIKSNFNPEGYYDPKEPVATRNYTLSMLAMKDSLFRKSKVFRISTPLPKQWGLDLFNAYRSNPDAFEWPSTMNEYFKGFYIDPSFGRGAIANVQATAIYLYYHHFVTRNVVENDVSVKKQVTIKDSLCLMVSSPEVLSSSIFHYKPSAEVLSMISAGKKLLTAPLGYHVEFTFPVMEILDEYWASDVNLLLINNLTLSIPAAAVNNDYGITPPPDLLLILRKDVDDFFTYGRVPDNKTSFRGVYSSTNGRYEFSSMRQYIVDLKNKKGNIKSEDCEFVLIPVEMETEVVTNYDGSKTTYVTDCRPYLQKPSMAVLETEKAQLVFTFTKQLMR